MFAFFRQRRKPDWNDKTVQELLHKFQGGNTIEHLALHFNCSKKYIQKILNRIFREMLLQNDIHIIARSMDIPVYWIRLILVIKK
jgi:hypothetical protein